MALIIDIYQMGRRDEQVEYEYTCAGRKGRFLVNVETQMIELLEPAPGERDGQWFQYAKRKITLALRQGELPQRVLWAS